MMNSEHGTAECRRMDSAYLLNRHRPAIHSFDIRYSTLDILRFDLKKRMSNSEHGTEECRRMDNCLFTKSTSPGDSFLRHSIFDIGHSAVRSEKACRIANTEPQNVEGRNSAYLLNRYRPAIHSFDIRHWTFCGSLNSNKPDNSSNQSPGDSGGLATCLQTNRRSAT
jgi:hypothetical protein